MNQVTSFLPYWRNETSGKLAKAVLIYWDFVVDENQLKPTQEQISLIRAYLEIWAEYPWQGNEIELAQLRKSVKQITRVSDISKWLDKALKLGIDPF